MAERAALFGTPPGPRRFFQTRSAGGAGSFGRADADGRTSDVIRAQQKPEPGEPALSYAGTRTDPVGDRSGLLPRRTASASGATPDRPFSSGERARGNLLRSAAGGPPAGSAGGHPQRCRTPPAQ